MFGFAPLTILNVQRNHRVMENSPERHIFCFLPFEAENEGQISSNFFYFLLSLHLFGWLVFLRSHSGHSGRRCWDFVLIVV